VGKRPFWTPEQESYWKIYHAVEKRISRVAGIHYRLLSHDLVFDTVVNDIIPTKYDALLSVIKF